MFSGQNPGVRFRQDGKFMRSWEKGESARDVANRGGPRLRSTSGLLAMIYTLEASGKQIGRGTTFRYRLRGGKLPLRRRPINLQRDYAGPSVILRERWLSNSRVHRFTKDGELFIMGQPGRRARRIPSAPPSDLTRRHAYERRANARVQIFTPTAFMGCGTDGGPTTWPGPEGKLYLCGRRLQRKHASACAMATAFHAGETPQSHGWARSSGNFCRLTRGRLEQSGECMMR